MALDEGVIKFQLQHKEKEAFSNHEIMQMQGIRNRLFAEQLIGGKNQNSDRCHQQYDDVCYGNISMRLSPYKFTPNKKQFLITGTQTGCLENITAADYTLVREYYPAENKLVSEGPIKPSSESMTHGMVYDIYHEARAVIHVHSPQIWYAAKKGLLDILRTDEQVAYGTPAMANEVKRIFRNKLFHPNGSIFSMDGHEDGIISFAADIIKAEELLMRTLQRAYELVGRTCDWK